MSLLVEAKIQDVCMCRLQLHVPTHVCSPSTLSHWGCVHAKNYGEIQDLLWKNKKRQPAAPLLELHMEGTFEHTFQYLRIFVSCPI